MSSGVREPTIQRVGNERIIVELAGIDDPERAKSIVERTAFLEFKLVREDDNFRNALPRIDRGIVQELGAENLRGASIEEVEPETPALNDILGTQPDSAGAAQGDTVSTQADAAADSTDSTEPEPDSASDTAGAAAVLEQGTGEPNLRPLTGLLLESGQPGVLLVAEEEVPTAERYLATEALRNGLPRNTELRWGAEPRSAAGAAYRELYVLEADAILTGDLLQDAGPAARDPQFNQPYVPFETTRRGSRVFQRGTAPNVGRYMAIVLDGRVQSAPVIRQTLSRRAQIEMGGGSSFQEAQDLALVLRAGALPMPIKVVEERSVSASLGSRLDPPGSERVHHWDRGSGDPDDLVLSTCRCDRRVGTRGLRPPGTWGTGRAWCHADPSGNRRPHPFRRNGRGRERADFRADTRGI